MDVQTIINDLPGIKFRTNVKYFQLTTLGVGSTAELVADVENDEQLAALLTYCRDFQIKTVIIGAGSNLVGSDEPLDAVIVRLKGDFVRIYLDTCRKQCVWQLNTASAA